MSNRYKECDSSSQAATEKGAYQGDVYKSIAQDGWNGHLNRCGNSAETASEHLPGLSIKDDKSGGAKFKEFLSKNDESFNDSEKFSKWRNEESRGRGSENWGSAHAPHDDNKKEKHYTGGLAPEDVLQAYSNDAQSNHNKDTQANHSKDVQSNFSPDNQNNYCRDAQPCDPKHQPVDYSRWENRKSDPQKDHEIHHDRKSQWNGGCPEKRENTDGGTSTPTDVVKPRVPNTTLSELTQLSEQLLPVHKNGSYPSVADWERLHGANVQKANTAASNGSDLLLFGDSITEAMGYNPAALQPFKKNFGGDNPTALGIGGDGTQQLLWRLNHGEMKGTPKAVVINIGTNDIGSLSTEQIANNVQKSIETIQLRSPETKIVLMGILPRTQSGDPGNARVDATNAALSRLATVDGAVQFVDLKSSFVDSNGNQRAELYQQDKLHLSNAGYQVWADGIKGAMSRIDNMPATPSLPNGNPGSGSGSGDSGSWNGNNGSGSGGGSWNGNSGFGSGTGSGDSGNWNRDPGTSNGDSGSHTGGGDSGSGDSTPIDWVPATKGVGSPLTTLKTERMRGVNLSGAEWGKNSSTDTQFWPTEKHLDYYKSKGMNTVRLMLSWEQLQPKLGGPLDMNEVNRLKNFLREADERGIQVLVVGGSFARYTLNHGPGGQGADGQVNGTRVGTDGVPTEAMADFWVKMVNEINTDPVASRAVGGWDLTNEPHTMNGTWPSIANAVHGAIRATGDQHTIVIEGDQWARNFDGLEEIARKDKNVAFQAHTYWDNGSGGYANRTPPADVNVGVNHIKGFVDWVKRNNVQGFVGEWGVPTTDVRWAPHLTKFIDFLDLNGIGNIVWAGGPGWQNDYTLSVEPDKITGEDKEIWDAIIKANAS